MKLVRINQNPILNLQSNFKLPSGKFKGMFVVFNGDSGAGVTQVMGDFGNCQLMINNNTLINVDADRLGYINNLWYGSVPFAAAEGGAFYYAFYIPFQMHWDWRNVLDIGDGLNVQFQHEYGDLSDVDSGNVTHYLVQGNHAQVQSYKMQPSSSESQLLSIL